MERPAIMALLSRDDILNAQDIDTQDVPVPEWGGTVRLRCLSGTERDKYEDSLAKMRNGQAVPNIVNARARLVAWSVVDSDGRRIFSDGDILRLGSKSGRALDRVFEAACKLSGISENDLEEMTEGFTDGQSEPSTTD
jgi:hypothetical protein